jgi:hypothetical protein
MGDERIYVVSGIVLAISLGIVVAAALSLFFECSSAPIDVPLH